jgi:hypothetical protein
MPEPFGTITKTKILKSESQKLHQEFTVDDLKATITFDGDLITANKVNGSINGAPIAEVTFDTDHDTTMDAIVAALEDLISVGSVSLTDATNNRQITIIAKDPDGMFILHDWAVTEGSGQAAVAVVTDTNNIYISQPVKLTIDGKVEPAGAAEAPYKIIGVSVHNGVGGDLVTLAMKAYMVVWAEAGTANLNAGPVKLHTTPFNTSTGYVSVDDNSVDGDDIYGWSLDQAVSAGDIVRVAVFS